jgi:hypothetical protein
VLADRFSPVRFDSQALLACVSPDLDLRYERVYAYLQDHVSRRRPSVDLLRLLCDGHGRLETRSWFTPGAPLRRRGLVTSERPRHGTSLLTAQSRQGAVVAWLLGSDAPDADGA